MEEQMELILLAAINVVAFFLYGIDKRRAVRHRERIPERVLLGAALFGGSPGALLGMRAFRHKTKQWKFRILVPAFLIFHLGVLLWLLF